MEVLTEREKTHGDFRDVAKLDQELKMLIYMSKNWQSLSDEHRVSLDMICHKISRILSGNPNEDDHWRDIAGYAELGRRACGEGIK